MKIDSEELKATLEKRKDKKNDIVSKSFNMGIEFAIKIIEIYEEVRK